MTLPPPVAHCSVFSSADEDRILVLVVRRGKAGRGRGWVATAEQYLSLGRDQFSRVGHTGRFEWVFHLAFFIFDFLPFDLYLIDFLRF